MASKKTRDAANQLLKYFRIDKKDTFIVPQSSSGVQTPSSGIPPGPDEQDDFIIEIYNDLYGDSQRKKEFKEILQDISKFISGKTNDKDIQKKLIETICLTPFSQDVASGITNFDNLPLNKKSNNLKQGSHEVAENTNYKSPKEGLYTIKEMAPKGQNSQDNDTRKINAIQVWPAHLESHGADADISALFLNSINSVVMSQAVPYVDILVSTAVPLPGSDPSKSDTVQKSFSLGTFLGAKKDDRVENTPFKDVIGKSVATQTKIGEATNFEAVASMEIFTSPQTLVNAENVSYNELNPGRIDAFRPYMSLDSVNIQVLPTGFGAISKKTADIQLTLFDKGRLRDIAPLVSPLAYNTIQFDITYGWSHPSGGVTAGRSSDAQSGDALGILIDSMKVTDTFTVSSSNFTFSPEGTVKISLKLVTSAMNRFGSQELNLAPTKTAEITAINDALAAIKKKFSGNKSKDLFLPVSVLEGSFDGFISMEPEDLEKLKKVIKQIDRPNSDNSELAQLLKTLVVDEYPAVTGKKKAKKGSGKGKKVEPPPAPVPTKSSLIRQYQTSRKQAAQEFLDSFKKTPDPFLPRGLKYGVTESDLKNKNKYYVSFGKILIAALGNYFISEGGEVVFVFGAFNQSAAAVRDLNVSQFPILLEGDDTNELSLKSVLESYFLKNSSMTPESFFDMIIANFFDYQGTSAYGLKEVSEPNPNIQTSEKNEKQKKEKTDAEKAAIAIEMESRKLTRLREIYGGKVTDPILTLPKLKMNVTCRKSKNDNVITVAVGDAACDPMRSIGDFFTDILGNGFCLSAGEETGNSDRITSARHGEVLKKTIAEMLRVQIIEKANDANISKENREKYKDVELSEILKSYNSSYVIKGETAKSIKKMREIFYNFFPTIIVGSLGSGVLSAELSSQQNDALKTIAISKAINQKADTMDPFLDYGMVLYPTQLSMQVIGSPVFKFIQRFFIDFATNTSADNFYVVTAVNMNFNPGDFKCSLTFAINDIFGRSINLRKSSADALFSIIASKSSNIKSS